MPLSLMRALFLLLLGFGAFLVYADQKNPLYLGVNSGYGSTIWKGLVPRETYQLAALSLSTPTDVHEGGFIWGGAVGFEFSERWAVEFNYLDYPKATIFFDENSLFAFENDGETRFETKTEALSLMAKIMLPVGQRPIRAYSSIGVGWIHRKDMINRTWLVVPSFGVGLNYSYAQLWIFELAE